MRKALSVLSFASSSPFYYARAPAPGVPRLLSLGSQDEIARIKSARRPALWALAHALLHEFAMACLPVRHPSFDGELLAFLERSGRRGGFALSRRSRNGEADRQDGRNRQRHDTHHILRDYLWRPRRPPSPR